MSLGLCRLTARGSRLVLGRPPWATTSATTSQFRAFRGSPTSSEEEKMKKDSHISEMGAKHNVDKFDRWVLVHYAKVKKYSSTDDVPNRVSESEMKHAKDRFRMRAANYMMLATIFAACCMIYKGKMGKPGESLESRNIEQHRKWDEERKKT